LGKIVLVKPHRKSVHVPKSNTKTEIKRFEYKDTIHYYNPVYFRGYKITPFKKNNFYYAEWESPLGGFYETVSASRKVAIRKAMESINMDLEKRRTGDYPDQHL